MLKWINKKRNKKGFTLVELVVVIAILGILAALAVPRFSGFTERAKEATDKATAATITNAVKMYVATKDITENIENGTLKMLEDEKLIESGLAFTSKEYKKEDNTITWKYVAEGGEVEVYGSKKVPVK